MVGVQNPPLDVQAVSRTSLHDGDDACDPSKRSEEGANPTPFRHVLNRTHPQWWKDPGLRKLNILLLSSFLGCIANGYDVSLIAGLEAIPRWYEDLSGLENPSTLGLAIASYPFGTLLAFFPAPWVADRLGRRWGIFISGWGIIAAIFGQCFCHTAIQYLGTRIIRGFFALFNSIGSTALLMELAHPRQRAVIAAMFNTFFFVGAIPAAWTSFGTHKLDSPWSWRIPMIVQLFFTVAQMIFTIIIPESPSWLVAHNRPDEAKATLAKYHANGDRDDDLVLYEFSEIYASIEIREGRKSGWRELFSTSANRRRVLICVILGLSVQWVGNGIITFYLAPVLRTVGISNTTQQQGINGGLQIWNWILSIAGSLLADRVGRRKLLLVSAIFMLLFMIMVTTCSAVFAESRSSAAGYAVVVFLFLFLGSYVIGFTPIPILYVNEIWPADLRAKGSSMYWVALTIALLFNQYVNPVALENINWKYYLVYVGVLIGTITFIYFYVPETKGKSSEELSGLFDSKRPNETGHLRGVASEEKGIVHQPVAEQLSIPIPSQVVND